MKNLIVIGKKLKFKHEKGFNIGFVINKIMLFINNKK